MREDGIIRQNMQQQGFVKKAVVGLLYPLLDAILPVKLAHRLKIAMNTLVGDWRMTCPYTFLPDPSGRKYSFDEFMSIFGGLSSISVVCKCRKSLLKLGECFSIIIHISDHLGKKATNLKGVCGRTWFVS